MKIQSSFVFTFATLMSCCYELMAVEKPTPAKKISSSAPAQVNAISQPQQNPYRNSTVPSFNRAKKLLVTKVYFDQDRTFYCKAKFKGGAIVDLNGYQPQKDPKRARRLEWEHVVPASAFGMSFKSWRDGAPECFDNKGKKLPSRKCASKVDKEFRYMEGDLYNLVPSIGELNALRGKLSFAEFEKPKTNRLGTCPIYIEDRKVLPPDTIKGDIARIYQYMEQAYPGRGVISDKNDKLYQVWSQQDPVDGWECLRYQRIKEVQQNDNPILSKSCEDFAKSKTEPAKTAPAKETQEEDVRVK